MAMLISGNRLPYLCNRLQHVPPTIYLDFKFWNLQLFSLSKILAPKFSSSHISLNFCPNHSPQSPNFFFFHSLSFEPIEISKNPFKWLNLQRSERALQVGVNDFPGHRKCQFLPPFPLDHCFHQRNNIYGTQTSFPLVPFMSLKLPVYSELVKAFYSNLEIHEGTLMSEVYGIKMVIDQSLFYDLTQFPSEGVPFEGALIDDWKFDFSVHDVRRLVCTNQTDMTGRLLADSLAFESHILHYLIVCILLPRSSNLAQVSKEDLIVMWAFHKRFINWLGTSC